MLPSKILGIVSPGHFDRMLTLFLLIAIPLARSPSTEGGFSGLVDGVGVDAKVERTVFSNFGGCLALSQELRLFVHLLLVLIPEKDSEECGKNRVECFPGVVLELLNQTDSPAGIE